MSVGCSVCAGNSNLALLLLCRYGKFVQAKCTDDSFILDKSFANSPAARLAQLRPGLIIEPGSPSMAGVVGGVVGGKNASGKTRAAFFLRTTPIAR